jgi:hypothetical protein
VLPDSGLHRYFAQLWRKIIPRSGDIFIAGLLSILAENSGILCRKYLERKNELKLLKGNRTSVAVLHLYDSFHQKFSKLGTYTTQGLKNNFYFRGFSISSGPEPCISDEYRQFFSIFNKVSKVPQP